MEAKQIKTVEDLREVILAGMLELDAEFTKEDWRLASGDSVNHLLYEILGTVSLNLAKLRAQQLLKRRY